ncbi:MAG TPA: hypothetical protein ENJ20_01895, partial [Bacteroidetes bacterium]|nr:hypothetical protein [Bacteroidota bacterium]
PDKGAQARAIFNVYFLFSIIGSLTALALYFSKSFINERLTSFGDLPFLNLLSLFVLFNAPAFLIQYFYLLLKRYKSLVVFGAVSFSFQLLVVVLPIYMGLTLREVVLGLIAWALLKYIWGVGVVARHGHWQLDFIFLKKYLPLFWPLLLLGLIGKGSEFASGLVVSALFADEKAFAVYRFGAREFPLAVLMVGALATALLPEVSADMEKGMERIKETTRRISKWLYPLSIFSMLASPFVFPVVFNPDFKESAYIFNIFTLLLASRILMPQVVAMGRQKNYILTVAALLEVGLLIGLSWWWGLVYGLRGVAFAMVVAFVFHRFILIIYNWKILDIAPGRYVDIKSWVFYNFLLMVAFLVSLQL